MRSPAVAGRLAEVDQRCFIHITQIYFGLYRLAPTHRRRGGDRSKASAFKAARALLVTDVGFNSKIELTNPVLSVFHLFGFGMA